MTVPPAVPQGSTAAQVGALPGSDRVELPLDAALAALGRLDRLRRPYGPVLRFGDRAAFLLAPGTADLVPELLGWLGWGEELGLDLRAHPAAPRVPEPRGAEDRPPRPERRPVGDSAEPAWLRSGTVPFGTVCSGSAWSGSGAGGPGPDLCSPDLLRLLDCLAQAAFERSYASRISLGTRPRSLTL